MKFVNIRVISYPNLELSDTCHIRRLVEHCLIKNHVLRAQQGGYMVILEHIVPSDMALGLKVYKLEEVYFFLLLSTAVY